MAYSLLERHFCGRSRTLAWKNNVCLEERRGGERGWGGTKCEVLFKDNELEDTNSSGPGVNWLEDVQILFSIRLIDSFFFFLFFQNY